MNANKPLLIIKAGNTIADLRATGEDFEHWFAAACGLTLRQCRVVSLFLGEPLPDLNQVGAIIVSGSPAYLTDLEPWNYTGADYLRRAHGQLPILGVCYGHQLLAWAFGGEVDFNSAGRQIGTVEVQLEASARQDPLLGGMPDPMRVQVSHQQVVTRLPPGCVLLAGRRSDPNHAFRFGQSSWGVQFHPEFDARITASYIKSRSVELEKEGFDLQATLAGVQQTSSGREILRRFSELAGLQD